jgi:thymidylate synthase
VQLVWVTLPTVTPREEAAPLNVKIRNVATGWREVLALFVGDLPTRLATRHGVSFDIPGLTVWLENPEDLTPPRDYPYPELIKDYRDRIFGDQRETSLLYQRLRKWTSATNANVDQIDGIVRLLRNDEHSRAAVFSVWHPEEDLGGPFPVSPVGGAFRVVDGELILFLTARSLDVWVGFVPELLTFAQLVSDVALQLRMPSSRICYHSWSAHLYEVDYLTYLGAGR